MEPPEDWHETAGRMFGAPNFQSGRVIALRRDIEYYESEIAQARRDAARSREEAKDFARQQREAKRIGASFAEMAAKRDGAQRRKYARQYDERADDLTFYLERDRHELESWEQHGYSSLDVATAQRAAGEIRWANDGHGFRVRLDVGANNWHHEPDAALRVYADFAYQQAMDAYDLLPENLQRRLNFSDARMDVFRDHSRTAAWAYCGTEAAPHFAINFGIINDIRRYDMPQPHGFHTRGELALDASQNVTFLVHEYGHLLDRLSNTESNALFDQMVAGGALTAESVSEYGLKNGREMVAEMFVDYLGGTLDATRPELRRVIDAMGWEE
jgi:hypothetical protein